MPTLDVNKAKLRKEIILVFIYADGKESNYCNYGNRYPSDEEILTALKLNVEHGVVEAFVRTSYRLGI